MPGPVFKREGVVLPWRFGELLRPDTQRLSKQQPAAILDPELPIVGVGRRVRKR